MSHPLDRPLAGIAAALRHGEVSAVELADEALSRHGRRGRRFRAYVAVEPDLTRSAARDADRRLAAEGPAAPPLCGVPMSVKDLYGVDGYPTWAGTARPLPDRWTRDGWLVARIRSQGAVVIGKTHTVELAYGAVGVNPHHATPRNPWDDRVARIPGGSSSGAGVSLWEGSAVVALGSDTGGSIRIPASMTGTVGHKTTKGRWPTDGVLPLSRTLDTVGALTRTAADGLWFFDAVDPGTAGEAGGRVGAPGRVRIGVPDSTLWDDCQSDIRAVLDTALEALQHAGWPGKRIPGALIDDAARLYFEGGIPGAECRAMLETELPGWVDILHPIVGRRLAAVPPVHDPGYGKAMAERARMEEQAHALFEEADVIVLPTAIVTPPPAAEMDDLERYVSTNHAALRPTCAVGMLGLCAVTLPVGLDAAGMPVGLQLVGPAHGDRFLLEVARAAEDVLGTAAERLGRPPLLDEGGA